MRKRLNGIVLDDFVGALETLGYYKVHPLEYKRVGFHLFLGQKGKNKLILSMHRDKYPSPPAFRHQTIYKGKALREEFKRIMEAYYALRKRR